MYDTVVVEVGDSGEGRSNQIGGIGLVVVAFSTDAIEKLSSEREVSYEVNYINDQLCA
jgi:hypothetical protein